MNLPIYENCVLDHRYFLGSFRDFSGNEHHATPTGVHFEKRPDKHVVFNSNADKITVADSTGIQVTAFTAILYGDSDFSLKGTMCFISKMCGGARFAEGFKLLGVI